MTQAPLVRIGEPRMPLAHLLEGARRAVGEHSEQPPGTVVVVGQVTLQEVRPAGGGGRVDVGLESGPAGEAVLTRQHQLGVVQREPGGIDAG